MINLLEPGYRRRGAVLKYETWFQSGERRRYGRRLPALVVSTCLMTPKCSFLPFDPQRLPRSSTLPQSHW
jgi:hypothetical protein